MPAGSMSILVRERRIFSQGQNSQHYNSISPILTKISLRVDELAQKKGVSMAQIATAWCLTKDGVTAPIVGTTKLENLRDIIGESARLVLRSVSN